MGGNTLYHSLHFNNKLKCATHVRHVGVERWGQDVDEVKLFTWQEQGTYLKENLIFSFPLSNICTCVQIVIIHAQDTSFPNKLKQRSPKITMCIPTTRIPNSCSPPKNPKNISEQNNYSFVSFLDAIASPITYPRGACQWVSGSVIVHIQLLEYRIPPLSARHKKSEG